MKSYCRITNNSKTTITFYGFTRLVCKTSLGWFSGSLPLATGSCASCQQHTHSRNSSNTSGDMSSKVTSTFLRGTKFYELVEALERALPYHDLGRPFGVLWKLLKRDEGREFFCLTDKMPIDDPPSRSNQVLLRRGMYVIAGIQLVC